MSAESQDDVVDPALMGRRDALKLAAGAGATTVGVSGAGLPDGLDLAFNVDALPYTGGTAAVNVAAAETAGIVNAITMWLDGADTDTEDGVLEDELYEVGNAVSDSTGPYVSEINQEGVPAYKRAAWQNIRTVVTRKTVNGATEADCESAAWEALDTQTTRALVNSIVQDNGVIQGLADQVITDYNDDSVTVFKAGNGADFFPWGLEDGTPISQPYAKTDLTNYLNYTFPVKPEDLEDFSRPDDWADSHVCTDFGFNVDANGTPVYWSSGDTSQAQDKHITIQHSTREDKRAYEFPSSPREIDQAYDAIAADLSTYVTNLYNAIHEGTVDPSRVLSSQDIVDRFADSSDQQRLAAELLAIGADVPQDVGFQAKISHPDLSSDSKWGWLYPQFADGVTKEVAPGSTIPSADYHMAYFGYESSVDGSFITRVLSGNSDLQILDLAGLPGEEDLEVPEDETAGSSGKVTVWTGQEENAPDAIRYPSDHSGWIVTIIGTSNEDSVPVGNLETTTNSDGSIEYYAASTALAEGELIEHKTIVPSTLYEQPIDQVSDPTVVTEEEIVERVNIIEERIEMIEKMDEGGGGGGWSPNFDVPKLGPIDTVGEWALAIGGTLVGSIALGNLGS